MLLHAITVINGITNRFLFHEVGDEFFAITPKLHIFFGCITKDNHIKIGSLIYLFA